MAHFRRGGQIGLLLLVAVLGCKDRSISLGEMVRGQERTCVLETRNTPLAEIVDRLHHDYGVPVFLGEGIDGQRELSLELQQSSWQGVLEGLAAQSGLQLQGDAQEGYTLVQPDRQP